MDQEIDIQAIKTKTTASVLFLTIRNFGIQGISTLGFFLLTLLLGAGDVGLFAIVAESVSILGYFSDVGLASALIQQKTPIKKAELQTTFIIQQLLVFTALIVASIIYSIVSRSHSYGNAEFWIVVSLCYSFVAASLKTIPSVQLERNLNFKAISTIDITENFLFYTFAVIFAYLGFGVYSYALATFIRSTIGLIMIYKISPWPIGLSFSRESAVKLFKFGIPFQLNSFIAVAKDRLSNLLVASIIGRESFGILAWAQKGPRLPLSFMDAIMKITFPTFSRLQHNPDLVRRSLSRSLFFVALTVTPMLVGVVFVASDFINLIPKYSKWLPAIFPLYFYAGNAAIAAITTPITNAFNAVGKIAITTKLMLMWTALTWIFYPILSFKFGYQGTAIATLIVGSSSFIVWFLADKIFGLNVFKAICRPVIASALMVIILLPVSALNLQPLPSIVLKIFVGSTTYLLFHLIFSKPDIIWFYQEIRCLVVKK
ncbi:MAG: oligosaccharide flippase family protein [Candidatus Shapirobacteria bacterium]|nr:oligosaccharide flippase family protein [Candidatus Shapirobacteria bacterium]